VLVHASAVLAELQQRGTWAEDGATSAAAWVAARTGERRAELASLVRIGSCLRGMPEVAGAARRCQIGFDHVRRIVDCARRAPCFDADDEAFLLEQARSFDAGTFRAVARTWRSMAGDAAAPEEPPDEPDRREFLQLSQTFDGWFRLDGELGPENGAIVAACLEEFVDKAMRAQRDGDPSLEKLPASSLRAEALVDLVAQHQRRDPDDHHTVADRYRVGILIRPDELPMAACDSDLYRVVMSAEGEVHDIGRTTRVMVHGDPPGGGRARRGVRLSRMRPPAVVARCPRLPRLGLRRPDLPGQRRPLVPARSQLHPPDEVAARDLQTGRQAEGHQT
jgi:hypothetical protein